MKGDNVLWVDAMIGRLADHLSPVGCARVHVDESLYADIADVIQRFNFNDTAATAQLIVTHDFLGDRPVATWQCVMSTDSYDPVI